MWMMARSQADVTMALGIILSLLFLATLRGAWRRKVVQFKACQTLRQLRLFTYVELVGDSTDVYGG